MADLTSKIVAPLPLNPDKATSGKNTEKVTGNKTVVEKKDTKKLLETKERIDIPSRTFIQYVYEFELYYIRKDSRKIDITQYINKFTYSMDFDNFVMPVITALLMVPELIAKDIKLSLDTLSFYITVKKFPRNTFKEGNFTQKEIVFKDRELQAVDPVFDINIQDVKKELKDVPRRIVKIDFLLKKDNSLNTNVESKVFSNVTVLDVIHYLTNKAKEIDKQNAEVKGNELQIIIDPPENTKKFEQIILDPGTITDNLYQLQTKYGVYKQGLRVYFNSVSMEPTAGKILKTERVLTVTSKGGIANADSSINKALFEILEIGQHSTIEVNSGSIVDTKSSTIISRTSNPYIIDKVNSKKLLHGESIRILGTSQNRNTYSECETTDRLLSKQRTYWNSNDNPYALSELQDSIKENDTNITIKVDDVDILSFNSNLEYTLKFYNSDDNHFSGIYRLTNTRFVFDFTGAKDKSRVAAGGLLRFSNIPKIKINDEIQEKSTYVDKLANLNPVGNDLVKATFSDSNPVNVPLTHTTGNINGPFRMAFAGKEDYHGVIIPETITPTYKMSKYIIFEDTYTTSNSGISKAQKLAEANTLCNNFRYFIAAQVFSTRILDVIITRYGKFKGSPNGKPNDFFRLNAKGHHPLAIACDMALTTQGNSLCDPFLWIVQNRSILGFYQVILEGNGKEWRWIHISCVVNGSNPNKITFTKNGMTSKPVYETINPNKFTSPEQAYFNNIRQLAL